MQRLLDAQRSEAGRGVGVPALPHHLGQPGEDLGVRGRRRRGTSVRRMDRGHRVRRPWLRTGDTAGEKPGWASVGQDRGRREW